jgi:hypothetical protein
MTSESKNPLGMVPDPYDGRTYVLPPTYCTDERKLWFRRSNEIIGFLSTTELAISECKTRFEQLNAQGKLRVDTPMKLESSDGRIAYMPTGRLLRVLGDGSDILCRQAFIMLYGSFETYLFELLERSFPSIGIKEDILERSLDIMMKRNWDGKLCKMSELFDLKYKASNLISHYKDFEIEFEGKSYKNPLLFVDELAQIRHKIIHASSMLGKGKYIFINASIFNGYYAFCALLTEFIDELFANRFGYDRIKINPSEA